MDHCANKVEELSVLLDLFVATVLIFSLFILLDQLSKIQAADREIDYWLILLFEKVNSLGLFRYFDLLRSS